MCIVDEGMRNMWNIFTKAPWRAFEKECCVELNWIALNVWEDEYIQYAWLKKDGGAEIEDGTQRLSIEADGFTYRDVDVYKCRKIVVPSWQCNFGCRALVLGPDEALRRLWRLYEKYKAKKAKLV